MSEQDLRQAGRGPLQLRLALVDPRRSWLGHCPKEATEAPCAGGALSVTCLPPPFTTKEKAQPELCQSHERTL